MSPQRTNQINGLAQTLNVTSGQSCIVSPTVSQAQSQTPQYNVVTNNNRGKYNYFIFNLFLFYKKNIFYIIFLLLSNSKTNK